MVYIYDIWFICHVHMYIKNIYDNNILWYIFLLTKFLEAIQVEEFLGEVKLFPRSIGAEPVFSIAKCQTGGGGAEDLSSGGRLVGCICYHQRPSSSLIFIFNMQMCNI